MTGFVDHVYFAIVVLNFRLVLQCAYIWTQKGILMLLCF